MIGYLARFAERRRADLRDDLTSMLIKVQQDGEVTLSDDELAGMLFLFVIAGHETEGRIGLSALYRRFPKLRMAVDPSEMTYTSFTTSGPASLPVHLY